jgi:PAS domain S-box-containing protein
VRHAELRTATEALDHEREAARRFFELSRDMMCIAGPDGFLRRVNPAFAVLGHSTQKLLETPFLAFVHPDDHASTWAVIDVHRGVGPSVQLENRWRCADGSYRWLWWTSTTDSSGIMYGSAREPAGSRSAALVHAIEPAARIIEDMMRTARVLLKE